MIATVALIICLVSGALLLLSLLLAPDSAYMPVIPERHDIEPCGMVGPLKRKPHFDFNKEEDKHYVDGS